MIDLHLLGSVGWLFQGRGLNPKQYSSRYVCSLVADFHRTLIYGGWAANPREHLRLVYEANPLAFLAEQVRLGLAGPLSKLVRLFYSQSFIQPIQGYIIT